MLGTDQTQSLYVRETDGDFKISISVTSGDETATDGMTVYNNISGGCGQFIC